ncbi:MAG: hypothetical protein MUC91_10200 [Verrucomicrobia bacterium]|nr:hypothetical protein [Verrucomicrobiota bacterium]
MSEQSERGNDNKGTIEGAGRAGQPARRPYAPPRILSSDPLEMAAVVCDPPTGGFGKPPTGAPTCARTGS